MGGGGHWGKTEIRGGDTDSKLCIGREQLGAWRERRPPKLEDTETRYAWQFLP